MIPRIPMLDNVNLSKTTLLLSLFVVTNIVTLCLAYLYLPRPPPPAPIILSPSSQGPSSVTVVLALLVFGRWTKMAWEKITGNSNEGSKEKETKESDEESENDGDKKEEKKKENGEEEKEDGKRWKKIEQIWDEKNVVWADRAEIKTESTEGSEKFLFVAKHRVYPKSSDEDGFTTLEFNSEPLVEILKLHIKESDSIYDDKPSVTVMEIFTFRAAIKEWIKEKKVKIEELEKLEKDKDGDGKGKEVAVVEKKKEEDEDDPESKTDKVYTLEELKVRVEHTEVLMQFISEEFHSVEAKLARLEPKGEIPWKLLWAICVPGMLMATNHAVTGERMGFRLKRGRYHSTQAGQVFCLNGVNFHWNGDRYISMPIERHIVQYRGLRKISSLGAFPMTDKIKEDLCKRADLYQRYSGTHFLVYEGSLAKRVNGKVIKLRADGRVMIDTKSFRRMSPDDDIWEGWDSDDEDLEDPNYTDYGAQGKTPQLTAEDKALTPPSVYGFSFALKEWGEMRLDGFTPVTFNKQIYDHLTIDPAHKKMIKALIQSNQENLITDVVSGKGGGCIFVLHGPPGTGKTLTAESIAELLERPLYIISSGQLGTQAYDMEQTLRDCLQVAEQWKAVLLIDEADVFLEARSEHEMARNALVAVFLRVLEYFQGVMILTTNRVKQFDPAFLSRISCALKYPSLDLQQRMVIWRKFLTLAGADVEETSHPTTNGITNGTVVVATESTRPKVSFKELKSLSEKLLNGRQIKNITRTAQALALSEGKEFKASYVETVIKLNEDFQEDFENPDNDSMYLAKGEKWRSRHPIYN